MEKLFHVALSAGEIYLILAICLLCYFSVWALIAIRKKRADLADIAWGMGFFLVAWVSFLLSQASLSSFILNLLITVWAIRLSTHIYLRNRNRKEDFRYQNLKKQWGKNIILRMFFQVFLFQGVILYIVALPVVWINMHAAELSFNALSWALPFWFSGFILETVGDYQLLRFQRDPSNRGKLLTTGVWSYVRHPNHLGEIVQWWSIWFMTLFLPFGWLFIVSPLLITFLIVKVSGVAPLEEKMKKHPDFEAYAKTTPSLFPFPLFNGTLYALAWVTIIYHGAKGAILIPFFAFILDYGLQFYFFSKYDRKSFLVSFPLSVYALLLGAIQEPLFIHFGILEYPNQGLLPPFWLLSLYPLFALTLNSSLSFLNRSFFLSFLAGGAGAIFSYLAGERLGGVLFISVSSYPVVFVFWGIFLTILVWLNSKLIALHDHYTDPKKMSEPLSVFFDPKCPVCSREMCALKKRKQSGVVIYETPQSDQELRKITNRFSYSQAMKKIHAIDAHGTVLVGIDVLAELYARTHLPLLAILLQAPGLRFIFVFSYAIWAKLRNTYRT